MKKIKLAAPAKINLGLSILKKLQSGYHEVRFIFQQVSLFDRIYLQEIKNDDIRVYCNHQDIPLNQINTVYQAAMLVKKTMKIKTGIAVNIEKNIPLAAGLGGGSSDAAQTLLGLNKIWNLGLNTKDLIRFGLKIGMDVAYQLVGGTKLATHLGEKLQKLPVLPPIYLVLCKPNVEVSTHWAYQHVDYSQIGQKQLNELIEAIKQKDVKKIAQNLHNDFEFWVPNFYPAILKIKQKMLKAGALGAMMSGSGPTVFGICPNQATAGKIAQTLKKDYQQTFVVENLI
ncbi:4-(cytidine 5'-diphospho)-2-C-methyl-D-erythritol kinase [Candidatus Shapirobacteria bacterium]|nr:4-(cytidine 5'-diphospho)-2-C-methyl-D-erythritol kinase [Candidatus Shapirobacteria bacterium]